MGISVEGKKDHLVNLFCLIGNQSEYGKNYRINAFIQLLEFLSKKS